MASFFLFYYIINCTLVECKSAGVGRVNSDYYSIPLHFSQSLHPDWEIYKHTQRDRERELFSCHFNFYSRLRFASSKFHREREREREEDSLFNAIPLLHILVSTTSLTLSHTTKSAMALPIGKVVVILGAGRSLSPFLKKTLIQLL